MGDFRPHIQSQTTFKLAKRKVMSPLSSMLSSDLASLKRGVESPYTMQTLPSDDLTPLNLLSMGTERVGKRRKRDKKEA